MPPDPIEGGAHRQISTFCSNQCFAGVLLGRRCVCQMNGFFPEKLHDASKFVIFMQFRATGATTLNRAAWGKAYLHGIWFHPVLFVSSCDEPSAQKR